MTSHTEHGLRNGQSQLATGAFVLDAVARVTRQCVYVFSLDTDAITYRDRSVLRELGHNVPDDLPMALWANYVHPDDRHHLRHLQLQWSTLRGDAVREGEYRIRDANGGYHWFTARETVMARHADGTVSHVLGALIEAITPVTGPDFFRSLADHLAETCHVDYACVVCLDTDEPMTGQTIALSHRGRPIDDITYDLRGTPCEEVAGKDFFHWTSGVQQQFPSDQALVDMRADSYMGIPLFTANRTPLGLIALLHSAPLEEPDRARTILHVLAPRVTAELERTLAERALRDSEAQLRQSQKLHAIGQLAGGVAHDFNNLLTVIMGYADTILSDVEASHPLLEAARHIHDAGERATLLTRQLLHFGRKAILEPRALDLNTAIRSTGDMLTRLIGEDVSIVAQLAPSLSLASVDRGQLEQVIINLCLNARDAMPQGGRILIETKNASFDEQYCRLHPAHKPGVFVELSITDTGTGMTPEVMSHLFEPFFTTKGQGKGTGLGLATVYGIVQQAAGFITVDSRPGSGSVFRVFMPAIAAQAPRPSVVLGPPPRGSETVLLVEDEEGVRRLARLSLERHGYTVLEANGGHAAIELADTYPGRIEILLTDVVMPGLNGREVSERLLARRPDLKVLFMSGYNDDAVVRHGIVGSPAAFLHKPFDSRTLATKLRDVLGHAATAPADAQPAAG
jgi:signal transduction histidine kinase/CheY-like chemotaxis protein